MKRSHADPAERTGHGRLGHREHHGGGAHEHHDTAAHRGHGGHGGCDVAHGTIASMSGVTFVLRTEMGELTVATSRDTSFHGLSRRRAREAGYEDRAAINTFAALKVGQRVAVKGERSEAATLHASRVHIPEP